MPPSNAGKPAPGAESDVTWLYDIILTNPTLAAAKHRVLSHAGQVSIEVAGGRVEAKAWREAIDGMIRPSWVDARGMRHWLIVGRRIIIDVTGPAD